MVARNGNALKLSNCNLFSLATTNVALIHNISKSAIKIGSKLILHKIVRNIRKFAKISEYFTTYRTAPDDNKVPNILDIV